MTAALAGLTWSVLVPHHARGARLARRQLTAMLAGRIDAGLLADVMTVVAELVGNAVRHARPLPDGMIRVTCQLVPLPAGSGTVRLRVTDGGSVLRPQQRRTTPESLNGRGLGIVAVLCQRWGVADTGSGRSVWAELGAPQGPG
ncbi:ATP-binding protein [Solwaraspora sp. WMMB335]|uniref:ATP-binding protein n=1 Tax=Solwaraspora sp. WMMB335 TaxID=3404118 RepID=UPI003B95B4EF